MPRRGTLLVPRLHSSQRCPHGCWMSMVSAIKWMSYSGYYLGWIYRWDTSSQHLSDCEVIIHSSSFCTYCQEVSHHFDVIFRISIVEVILHCSIILLCLFISFLYIHISFASSTEWLSLFPNIIHCPQTCEWIAHSFPLLLALHISLKRVVELTMPNDVLTEVRPHSFFLLRTTGVPRLVWVGFYL